MMKYDIYVDLASSSILLPSQTSKWTTVKIKEVKLEPINPSRHMHLKKSYQNKFKLKFLFSYFFVVLRKILWRPLGSWNYYSFFISNFLFFTFFTFTLYSFI